MRAPFHLSLRVLFSLLLATACRGAEPTWDVAVYGGTSAGVIAAVHAARMGRQVVLVEPGRHLGGMTSGGLGATDLGREETITGATAEFYQRILKWYQAPERAAVLKEYAATKTGRRYLRPDRLYAFEPHVAEAVFQQMLAEAKVTVVFGEQLDLQKGVEKAGTRIVSARMESGRVFAARVFIDATYEGDLMAKSGVDYTAGRESSQQYGERSGGAHLYTGKQSPQPMDPYVNRGDAASGLLPGLKLGPLPRDGSADANVQAYNFRLCLTQATDRVPFAKPDGYDPLEYELMFRLFEMGVDAAGLDPLSMPGGKSDSNSHGTTSTDWVGRSFAYPEADYAERAKIIAAHRRYTEGLLWTLANDPRVPEKVRDATARWGLPRDEFTDNGHWPHQLYVREARRMVGAFVMTEHALTGTKPVEDPVALGSYRMDCHGVQRYIDNQGYLRLDGGYSGCRGFPPYGVSYRALMPKPEQCANLLVPVCLSASHSAIGSLRMEPVYMMLGQAAGTAASLAIEQGKTVHEVPYSSLRTRLLADGLMLQWTAPPAVSAAPKKSKPAGLFLDEGDSMQTGEWRMVTNGLGVNGGYAHDANKGKGKLSAEYRLAVPKPGLYEVRLSYVPHANRATNVPVTIESAEGKTQATVNEQKKPELEGGYILLGKLRFTPDKPSVVTIRNEGTDGHVVIDAVQLVPVK